MGFRAAGLAGLAKGLLSAGSPPKAGLMLRSERE